LSWKSRTTSLKFRDTAIGCEKSSSKVFVLLVKPSKLNDDVIEKVIYFVLVIAFTEFGWLKPLVDYIFWS
jgi:hypothetical protein